MDDINKIKIGEIHNILVTSFIDSGKKTVKAHLVTIYTILNCNMKGFILAEDIFGDTAFEAIIPGNMPIKNDDNKWSIHFGKCPSTSYKKKRKKPVPTLWEFEFSILQNYGSHACFCKTWPCCQFCSGGKKSSTIFL